MGLLPPGFVTGYYGAKAADEQAQARRQQMLQVQGQQDWENKFRERELGQRQTQFEMAQQGKAPDLLDLYQRAEPLLRSGAVSAENALPFLRETGGALGVSVPEGLAGLFSTPGSIETQRQKTAGDLIKDLDGITANMQKAATYTLAGEGKRPEDVVDQFMPQFEIAFTSRQLPFNAEEVRARAMRSIGTGQTVTEAGRQDVAEKGIDIRQRQLELNTQIAQMRLQLQAESNLTMKAALAKGIIQWLTERGVGNENPLFNEAFKVLWGGLTVPSGPPEIAVSENPARGPLAPGGPFPKFGKIPARSVQQVEAGKGKGKGKGGVGGSDWSDLTPSMRQNLLKQGIKTYVPLDEALATYGFLEGKGWIGSKGEPTEKLDSNGEPTGKSTQDWIRNVVRALNAKYGGPAVTKQQPKRSFTGTRLTDAKVKEIQEAKKAGYTVQQIIKARPKWGPGAIRAAYGGY